MTKQPRRNYKHPSLPGRNSQWTLHSGTLCRMHCDKLPCTINLPEKWGPQPADDKTNRLTVQGPAIACCFKPPPGPYDWGPHIPQGLLTLRQTSTATRWKTKPDFVRSVFVEEGDLKALLPKPRQMRAVMKEVSRSAEDLMTLTGKNQRQTSINDYAIYFGPVNNSIRYLTSIISVADIGFSSRPTDPPKQDRQDASIVM